MKYFKMYKEDGAIEEVSRGEAEWTLSGWWNPEYLDDIFDNKLSFRLYTPFAEVWTKTEDGEVPIAGLYGVCDD